MTRRWTSRVRVDGSPVLLHDGALGHFLWMRLASRRAQGVVERGERQTLTLPFKLDFDRGDKDAAADHAGLFAASTGWLFRPDWCATPSRVTWFT